MPSARGNWISRASRITYTVTVVTLSGKNTDREWVFLLYRLPRTPSGPRLALWRALRRLGAVLVADGVAALPRSPRTTEHFEWLAAAVNDDDGTASVWTARPASRAEGERLARELRNAVEAEYRQVIEEASQARAESADVQARCIRRLRRQLRRIAGRDYFAAAGGGEARDAIAGLAGRVAVT